MGAFLGSLNQNKIQNAIYNMIISQEVFADNIGVHQTLVDKARVEGGLLSDQKLFYATDVLKSSAWGDDSEAANLLALHRPKAPSVQAITLNVFRQICLTTDNYLSRQAFATEGAFGSYTSVMVAWMNDTKRIYEGTLYNVFIGATESATNGQTPDAITLSGTNDGQVIAKTIADLLVKLEDYNTMNDYGYLRSYSGGDIKIVWNSDFVNKIKKVDLPTIFHKDGLVDKLDDDVMAPRYFGYTPVAGTDVDSSTHKAASGKIIRSRKEVVVNNIHYFPGDKFDSDTTFGASKDVALADAYVEDPKVICKVLVKLPPMMTAFSVGTSFINKKSLTENHYLTFGHNTLEYLKNYPFITIKKA